MYTPDESQATEAFDLDLAFRICAIRETFEEIGILLGSGIVTDNARSFAALTEG